MEYSILLHGLDTQVQWLIPSFILFSIKFSDKLSKKFFCAAIRIKQFGVQRHQTIGSSQPKICRMYENITKALPTSKTTTKYQVPHCTTEKLMFGLHVIISKIKSNYFI